MLQNTREVENYTIFGEMDDSYIQARTPYSLKKIHLFSHVVDLHFVSDTSEIYETPWALHWKKLSQESLISENAIQSVSLGSTHTIVTSSKGKLYSWGWNDRGQCCEDSLVDTKEIEAGIHASKSLIVRDHKSHGRVQQVVSGEDHTLLRDINGEVFAWGANSKG